MDAIQALKSRSGHRLGKLRPVGSRVPAVGTNLCNVREMAWSGHYHTEFSGSGTAALSIAVAIAMAIADNRRPAHPEVILPAYGCPDLVAAIVAQGAKPILVDLVPSSHCMDLDQVDLAIRPATIAVIGVGLLGVPERLERLSALCRRRGIVLIEDSAQCFPPASSERGWADLVVLSFSRGKPVNLMGGGALLVRRDLLNQARSTIEGFPIAGFELGLKWRLKRWLFNLLLNRIPYLFLEKLPGLNLGETRYRPLQRVQRMALPEALVRAGVAQFNSRPVTHIGYVDGVQALSCAGWSFLEEGESNTNCMPRNRFGILAPSNRQRDLAERCLNEAGIGASSFYRRILPDIGGIADCSGDGDFLNARNFADRLLTLPSHEDVTEADVARTNDLLRALSRPSIS